MVHPYVQGHARGWFSVGIPGKGSQPVTFSLCQAWTTYSSRSTRLFLFDYMPSVGIVKRGSYGIQGFLKVGEKKTHFGYSFSC